MNLLWRMIGRVAFVAALPFLALFVSRQERARVLVVNEQNEVLLVKGVFSWNQRELPGGGAKRGESLKDAAVREVREEVGVRLEANALIELGAIETTHRIARMRLRVYGVRVTSVTAAISSYEIAELQWWPLTALPEDKYNNITEAVSLWGATTSRLQ